MVIIVLFWFPIILFFFYIYYTHSQKYRVVNNAVWHWHSIDTHNCDKIKSIVYLTYRGTFFVYLKKIKNKKNCIITHFSNIGQYHDRHGIIAGSSTDIVFEHFYRFLPSGRPFWVFRLLTNRLVFHF